MAFLVYLTKLTHLSVNNNLFISTFPDLSYASNLSWFNIGSNNFSGDMPSFIGQTAINYCNIRDNDFNLDSCLALNDLNLPLGHDNACMRDGACIDECNSNPCENGATCSEGTIHGYSCDCADGYNGENCQNDINECSSNPCENFGDCYDQIGDYMCDCLIYFEGKNCEINIDNCVDDDDNPICLNGATCDDGMNEYYCWCADGFSGTNCEIDINECQSNPCENGATCVDGINSFTCTCPSGFHGNLCEDHDQCESNPCQNGATCTDGYQEYNCECALGFEGDDCEINIDDCWSTACLNGGTCVDAIANYTCICDIGWKGYYCDIESDPCASNPCLYGSTCIGNITTGDYTCECNTDRSYGTNCENPYQCNLDNIKEICAENNGNCDYRYSYYTNSTHYNDGRIVVGDYIQSRNHKYFATMEADGNFIIYKGLNPDDVNKIPLKVISANENVMCMDYRFSVQRDAHLVIYNYCELFQQKNYAMGYYDEFILFCINANDGYFVNW